MAHKENPTSHKATKDKEKVSFKDTLNLPQTDFPIRAQAKKDDPEMITRWEHEDLFVKSFYHNEGHLKFILHDGPPYANGHIHLGTAYNKILKDVTAKYHRMTGQQVPVTPGWDCHGLPIELKVAQENKDKDLSPHQLMQKCREYAQQWIDIQRAEFKNLGVLFNWSNPYLTMNFSYEADELRAFGIFVDKGYIERKNKTVPWCASCQTVLATAEIEYAERKDPSIYVLFPLEASAVAQLFPSLAGKQISLLIWTTTPWTIPLNRAVLVKPDAQYVVLEANGQYFAVAKALADPLCTLFGIKKNIVAEFDAEQLLQIKAQAHHPFVDDLLVPVLPSENVSVADGTAFVHCAPGCGPEDYEVGIKNKLEIFSPISPDGKYTFGIAPKELENMSVVDGQIWVIKRLAADKKLLFKNSIRHSYPHCWRCRNGLIFRATKQWFCDLEKHNLKEKTLTAIETVTTYPKQSKNRIYATVEGRLEWCLSRQRIWGVPIPALLCANCDYAHTSKAFIDKVATEVEKNGIEYWHNVPVEAIMPSGFLCPICESAEFKKETDILDVWFDSGVSHYAVLRTNPELGVPANMYLEGKDQSRGWFQSSLLTAMVLEGQPPMRSILTHGYTVDKDGKKMSKSLGNVVTPQEIIDKVGTDGLRLWVSSIDYGDDASVSDVLLKNVQEVFRKIRNTCRFLLSNLNDFDFHKDRVDVNELLLIDQLALQELFEFQEKVLDAYSKYDFTRVFHLLADYCSVHLSSFYLDIIKDRLYVEKRDGNKRRSAQTSCWYILDALTKLIAPILSFTAEQLSDHYQKDKTESIHLQQFAKLENVWRYIAQRYAQLTGVPYRLEAKEAIEQEQKFKELENQWQQLKEVRSALLKAIELLREDGVIKHSLEADVRLFVDKEKLPAIADFIAIKKEKQSAEDFLKEFLIVSHVSTQDNKDGLEETILPGLFAYVAHAKGKKCPRCWNWDITEHEHGLCRRCQSIVTNQ